MSGVNTDIAGQPGNILWNVWSGGKNTFTITVTLNAAAYSLATRTFSLQIRNVGGTTNLLNLTQGSGITNGGATGILTIVLTAVQAATLRNNTYEWQLSITEDETRWLGGSLSATNGVPAGGANTSLTVPVSLTGTALSVELSLGGGAPAFADITGSPSDNAALAAALALKQATLVSGTNIKTINGNSLLGAGDLTISGGSGSNTLFNYQNFI